MSEAEQKQEVILDTRPKPFVFVLMPFDTAFTDVYQLGIKPACEKAGAYAERLDEQMFTENMLQRIYNQIAVAHIVVADMTGKNPNVFYEVGYAHALGKTVILLTQNKDDIPFDLKHYRHIVYQSVSEVRSQLETTVAWAVTQITQRIRPELPVAVYLQGSALIDDPTITLPMAGPARELSWFALESVCGNNNEVRAVTFRMALWTSGLPAAKCQWGTAEAVRGTRHPKGDVIFTNPELISLLPAEWRTMKVTFVAPETPRFLKGMKSNMVLRISTELGSYNYPFTIAVG